MHVEMAPWSSTQWYNHLSRRKPPPLSMIPITLACLTTFLVLIYISSISQNMSIIHDKQNSAHPLLELTQHDVVSSSAGKYSLPSVTFDVKNKSNDDQEDKLFFNDTTSLPPMNFPLLDGSHINQNNYDDEVYHDKAIFLKNYKEMKKNLKIHIYPHTKKDPFATSLLPVEDHHDPGGNYASEAYFKKLLYKSHFVTNDSSKADLFFVPFSIASLRNDRRVGVGGLANFIRGYMSNLRRNYPYWNATGGADHFYVACHSVGRMAMEKVDYVKSNAIQVICSSSYFLPNYFAHKDVSLPQIWPRHEEPPNLGLSKRKKLAFFAGSTNSPVRKAVLQAWQNDSSIFAHNGRLKTPYSEQLLGSKYCLHVKGFEVNTARIGDALCYGCVPVVLADYYDLPFMDILNWKTFSVVITTSDIPNLKKILLSISPEEYSVLQANVLKVRKHFQWNKTPQEYDTFYMVMYELWLRRGSIRIFS